MSELEAQYSERRERFLIPAAAQLETYIRHLFQDWKRIDRITARAKSVDRFLQKAAKKDDSGHPKYTEPLKQLQDRIGCRVVTFYYSDVQSVATNVRRYLRPIESKELIPDVENEFGYIGQHFIMLLPPEAVAGIVYEGDRPKFFELQIKTLFQHAWAEANHDLAYKPPMPLTSLQKRKIAFTAAQAWGADQIFQELYQDLASDIKE